jgi:hypothetical protein
MKTHVNGHEYLHNVINLIASVVHSPMLAGRIPSPAVTESDSETVVLPNLLSLPPLNERACWDTRQRRIEAVIVVKLWIGVVIADCISRRQLDVAKTLVGTISMGTDVD